MKKVPLRSCIITKEKLPKKDLLRIVRDKDGNVTVDITGKSNGRGAYIKKDINVLEEARNKKLLSRVLEAEIPENIYEEIENIIKNN